MVVSIMKISRSHGRLIFKMGTPTDGKTAFIFKRSPATKFSFSKWPCMGCKYLTQTSYVIKSQHAANTVTNTCKTASVHYNDVIMGAMASQITGPTIVYSTVYSGADQRKYQSSASLAFVQGIHR